MKKWTSGAVTVFFFLLPFFSFSQQPDTLIKKLDSLSDKRDSVGFQHNDIKQIYYNENTRITLPVYFILLGDDIKQQITAPFHTSKKDWVKVGKFAVLAGALSLADEPIQRTALRIRNNNQTVKNVSKYVTNFGGLYEGYTLAALGAYGLVFKNEKVKTTTLLATQAYLTGATIESMVKFLTGRLRPSYYEGKAMDAEPTFLGPFHKKQELATGKRINSSFPSGHTTVAFAAATVFAMEYHDRPLIPILSYGAATLIGVSRLTENKHWASDVLVGAALGYLCGYQVVNNYHRYAKIQNAKLKNHSLSLTFQYHFGYFQPGLTYRF